MIGIYCIENIINNKKYIGQSKDIDQRWKDHRWSLNRGDHCNRHLQASWNKYGEESFCFYVVEECDELLLEEREKYYISYYDTFNNGYNLTIGGEGTFRHTLSEEVKIRIGNAHRGKEISETQRYQISLRTKGKNNPFYGKTHSLETKEKISKFRKEKGLSKYGKNNHAKKVICDGIEYDCAQRCADYYNIKSSTLRSWLRGNRSMPEKFVNLGLRYI